MADGKLYSKDVLLILTASFFYFSCPMLVTPIITGFSGSLGASAALMGLIGGMMNLCSLFCRPFAGNLADVVSKSRLSIAGTWMMAAACLGYMLALGPRAVAAFRVIHGIGFACCSVCMATWMSNLLPRDKIGSGMGLYGAMNALAMALAPALGIFTYRLFGYRAAFGVAMLSALVSSFVIMLIKKGGEPSKKERAAESRRSRGFSFIYPRVVPAALIIMLFAIPYCATQSFIVGYTEARGLHVSVGLFFPFYAAVLLVLRLCLKSLFDKLPFRVFQTGASLCTLAAIICLSLMQSDALLLLAAAFMAGSYGIMSSVCQSAAMLAAGPEHRGLANSTYYIGFDLGMMLGPVCGGLLFGHAPLSLFYPALALAVPLAAAVYMVSARRGMF
ncbi:MFS transporter [Cloacibacillus sp. An23]|uniref:MFS transporter n=1 Tax=Cloacibacillus sp. An23 TaxID=1965591 RepID=UPI000B36FDA1|nr:MFS transporter [Cloacibacillus sp. An23]OUO94986.1 MFS transporter [Cloacibacillus sp. An23]